MNWNKRWIRWNYIKMKIDSIFSMRRRERTWRSFKPWTILSGRVRTLCTTCLRILFMLMTMDLSKKHYLSSQVWTKVPSHRPTSTSSVMISTRRCHCATISMRTNGLSRNFLITCLINSTNAPHLLPYLPQKSSSPVEDHHPRKMLESIWLKRMKSSIKPKWPNQETLMLSLFARVLSTYLEVSLVNKDFAL